MSGHSKSLLIWACSFGALDPSRVDALYADKDADPKHVAVCRDVRDPAKLAVIIGERMRLVGVYAYCYADGEVIVIVDPRDGHNRHLFPSVRLLLPQARAALLRILTMPEGATAEEVAKALIPS